MDNIERLSASEAIVNISYEYIYYFISINDFGIITNIVYDINNKIYYPKIYLKCNNINNLDYNIRKDIKTKYINTIKKFDNYFDALKFAIDIIIFLVMTIYIRYLDRQDGCYRTINYLKEEFPIPVIVNMILKNNHNWYYKTIENKIIEKVDWTKLVNSFTREIISKEEE